LDERVKRLYVAQKAIELKHGGIVAVHRLTGISQTTIIAGIKELKSRKQIKPNNRSRAPGGGRKSIQENQPELKKSLIKILEETTVGDPMSALRWTSKSLTNITEVLISQGFTVSRQTVHGMIKDEGYSLRGNVKTVEGKQHPDRDKQFEYINDQCAKFFLEECPVISVDTKKKELVGNFKNPGKELCKKDNPVHVNTYDFPNLSDGKAIPYGTYDLARNEAFVNVGTSHDTPEFAVASIKTWWREMGSVVYPTTKKLLICADGGGSNSSKSRMWKANLQEFSDNENIEITVCHFPPGTSKWNKIEHRLFSFISMNWRGKPLVNYETIVNLIANTKTKKGLLVKALIDQGEYKTGKKISNPDFENISISYHAIDCGWNYTISPRNNSR
jgi:Rhodopirellula transposase DDE domain